MRRYGWWRNAGLYNPNNQNSARAVKKAQRIAKTRALKPVVAPSGNRPITRTVWGTAWCNNLDYYSDYVSRLPRGRSYLRSGAVADLRIEAGKISALVKGKDLYHVNISVKPVAGEAWGRIRHAAVGQVDSLVDLIDGKLSDEVMEVVTSERGGLFPAVDEIEMSCTCPDWAVMCKHVAAVLYGVGVRLDDSPELLFTLRGVDPSELVSGVLEDEVSDERPTNGSDRRLDMAGDQMAELFGIELDGLGAVSRARPKSALVAKKNDALQMFPHNLSSFGQALVSEEFLSERGYLLPSWVQVLLHSRPSALGGLALLDRWDMYVASGHSPALVEMLSLAQADAGQVQATWARHVLREKSSVTIAMDWQLSSPASRVGVSILHAHVLEKRSPSRWLAGECFLGRPTAKQRREAEVQLVDQINEWLAQDASVILVATGAVGDEQMFELLDFMGWRYAMARRKDRAKSRRDRPKDYDRETVQIERLEDVPAGKGTAPIPVVLECHSASSASGRLERPAWQVATNLTLAHERDILGMLDLADDLTKPLFMTPRMRRVWGPAVRESGGIGGQWAVLEQVSRELGRLWTLALRGVVPRSEPGLRSSGSVREDAEREVAAMLEAQGSGALPTRLAGMSDRSMLGVTLQERLEVLLGLDEELGEQVLERFDGLVRDELASLLLDDAT